MRIGPAASPAAAALLPFLLHLLVRPSTGWVTIQQTAYGSKYTDIAKRMNGSIAYLRPDEFLGRIWHMPASSSDTYGLGGGITYAWDPNLCADLLPNFQESIPVYRDFLKCGDM